MKESHEADMPYLLSPRKVFKMKMVQQHKKQYTKYLSNGNVEKMRGYTEQSIKVQFPG